MSVDGTPLGDIGLWPSDDQTERCSLERVPVTGCQVFEP
jgi:hypothetical protein